MANRKQTKLISIRLTPEAHRRLVEMAHDACLPLSSFVKSRVFAPHVADTMSSKNARPTPDIITLQKLLAHVGKIGSNVNQYARKANSTGVCSGEAEKLYSVLDNRMQKIKDILIKALEGKA